MCVCVCKCLCASACAHVCVCVCVPAVCLCRAREVCPNLHARGMAAAKGRGVKGMLAAVQEGESLCQVFV